MALRPQTWPFLSLVPVGARSLADEELAANGGKGFAAAKYLSSLWSIAVPV